MNDAPPPGPTREPALTRADAEVELQRLNGIAARAIATGCPPHIALAALEVHLARLLDRVFAEARRG